MGIIVKYYYPEKKVNILPIHFFLNKKIASKAGIYVRQGKIFFDRDLFAELSQEAIFFMLFHEIGHNFYYNETKCDIFAINSMLKLGYSLNQIYSFIKETGLKNVRLLKIKKYLLWIIARQKAR